MKNERLELANKLQEMETRKDTLERLLHDSSDFYAKDIMVTVNIGGLRGYGRQYQNEHVYLVKKLFVDFLKSEIANLGNEIDIIISKLTNK